MIAILIIVGILSFFLILNWISKITNKLTPAEVADIIERFINGEEEDYEWDDFTSIPINDPYLEIVRKVCSELPSKFPPTKERTYCSEAGVVYLKNLVRRLRTGNRPFID
jgi:hypothetical protein